MKEEGIALVPRSLIVLVMLKVLIMCSICLFAVCADDYVYDVYALGEDAVGGEADILDYPM